MRFFILITSKKQQYCIISCFLIFLTQYFPLSYVIIIKGHQKKRKYEKKKNSKIAWGNNVTRYNGSLCYGL